MKYRPGLFVATLALCLSIHGTTLSSQDQSDTERIKQLLNDYVIGWREGDKERLADVFALEKGTVVWVSSQSGKEMLESMTFDDVLKRQKPRPEYGLDWKVLTLDIVDGKLAVAKVHISRRGGSYIDVLVFQKIADQWRIVNKSFVVR